MAMVAAGEARPACWPNANRILNQGGQPECVAFGVLGLLNTDDEMHNDPGFSDADARAFFTTIPGADPRRGACIRDGLKAAKAAGLVAAYALLRTDAEVDEWLGEHGPVLVGSVWTRRMMRPVKGVVLPDAIVSDSGHCYFWHGQDNEYRLGTNSWGHEWGEAGRFRMFRDDDAMLQREGGEAWAIVQPVRKVAAPSLWSRVWGWFGRS